MQRHLELLTARIGTNDTEAGLMSYVPGAGDSSMGFRSN